MYEHGNLSTHQCACLYLKVGTIVTGGWIDMIDDIRLVYSTCEALRVGHITSFSIHFHIVMYSSGPCKFMSRNKTQFLSFLYGLSRVLSFLHFPVFLFFVVVLFQKSWKVFPFHINRLFFKIQLNAIRFSLDITGYVLRSIRYEHCSYLNGQFYHLGSYSPTHYCVQGNKLPRCP